jgi:cell division protein FtsB
MNAFLGQRRLIVFITVLVGAFILYFPARALVSQRGHIDALEERRTALRAQNQRLSDQAERLSDPAELEVLARERLGLVRPGERAYFVEPTEVPREAPEAETQPSLWNRVWSWITSLARGNN